MNGDMYQAEHKETEPPPLKDQMDYAMKHFNFIAEQRLKTFHFYAILLAGSIAGTLSGIKESVNVPLFLICGVLHFLLALVFSIIERRNLHLLGIARGGVAFVEQSDGWPERLRLCCIDYRETRAWSRRKYFLPSRVRRCLRVSGTLGNRAHSMRTGGITSFSIRRFRTEFTRFKPNDASGTEQHKQNEPNSDPRQFPGRDSFKSHVQ
jgi:hypothetical protein